MKEISVGRGWGKEVNMPETERSIRYRVNVSTSIKGVKTWDCTVDMHGYEMNDVLNHSDALVEELEKRYPIEKEVK